MLEETLADRPAVLYAAAQTPKIREPANYDQEIYERWRGVGMRSVHLLTMGGPRCGGRGGPEDAPSKTRRLRPSRYSRRGDPFSSFSCAEPRRESCGLDRENWRMGRLGEPAFGSRAKDHPLS